MNRTEMFNYLLFALGFSFACVVQPGPFQAYLLSQSLISGWRKAFPLIFIPLISDIPVIVIVLLILSNIPPAVLTLIQCIGGVFLFYLAYKAFRTWRTFGNDQSPEAAPSSAFFKGILVNVLNPNAYIGWGLVMGPMLMKGWRESPVNGIVLLISFYGSMLIYSFGLIMLFAAARSFGPRVTRASILVSSVALAVFGAYQLLSVSRIPW